MKLLQFKNISLASKFDRKNEDMLSVSNTRVDCSASGGESAAPSLHFENDDFFFFFFAPDFLFDKQPPDGQELVNTLLWSNSVFLHQSS